MWDSACGDVEEGGDCRVGRGALEGEGGEVAGEGVLLRTSAVGVLGSWL